MLKSVVAPQVIISRNAVAIDECKDLHIQDFTVTLHRNNN
jgi:hypothetical protein